MALDNRKEALERVAFNMGMKYLPKDEWGQYRLLKDFRLFRRGRHRRITNLLIKRDESLELTLNVFDYRFVIGGGNHHRRIKQTVFFIESKKLGLPDFLMKPEKLFHKLGEYLGMQDIDFEAFPDFSNQYLLQGDDEDYIRSVLGKPDFLRFFTTEKNWSLEGSNYYLIFYRRKKILAPAEIQNFVEKGMKIFKILKVND
ncbi:MAG: hypothetical protein DHS20C18_35130 [Saprospiraceae bacterium]|nr:MAG: hypothetical protein DHS20C18_35130 [Saprospiraceae bacterium]